MIHVGCVVVRCERWKCRVGARLNKGTFVFLFVTSVTFLQIPPYKRKGILRRMEESKGIAEILGNSEEIWILAIHYRSGMATACFNP
eukprot:scaffold142552_cov36-Cyclotella_meneghiniana.AAC.1